MKLADLVSRSGIIISDVYIVDEGDAIGDLIDMIAFYVDGDEDDPQESEDDLNEDLAQSYPGHSGYVRMVEDGIARVTISGPCFNFQVRVTEDAIEYEG